MAKGYTSLKDLLANENLELARDIEKVVHQDENIANNRLFVWNFEQVDLEEFLTYFQMYKDRIVSVTLRQNLSSQLMRKVNNMIREGYNPVECMLYASKCINMRLQNDKELQTILAERIRDAYLAQEDETIAVIKNILKMWTWVPQINVVITAIGLIGDNQELLDNIMLNYAEDPIYKTKVFYAFMHNKNVLNLERALRIIINLQDNESDNILGRAFVREIDNFGQEGKKIVAQYYGNPGISRTGVKYLRNIMLRGNSTEVDSKDKELYLKTLATQSEKDDLAYKEFLEECYQNYNDDIFYLCRYSRADIGSFLKVVLEDKKVSVKGRNTAIISLANAGRKGYAPAVAILDTCEKRGGNEYAVIIANIMLENQAYAMKLAKIFSTKKDYDLSELYGVLKSAAITSYRYNFCIELIHWALEECFREYLENEDYEKLECLTSNFEMFWDKKLYALLSKALLEAMQGVLLIYAENEIDIPNSIIVSMMETIEPSWNANVEKVMFALYHKCDNRRIQDLSFKMLKDRKIEPPK